MKSCMVLLLLANFCMSIDCNLEENTQAEKSSNIFCNICKNVVQEIEKNFGQGMAEDEAEKIISKMCDAFGHELGQICRETLLPTIKDLYEVLNPNNLKNTCKNLELCTT